MDEKWSFVATKEESDETESNETPTKGENWDHVAIHPEHRLILSVIPGKRTAENCKELVQDVNRRTEERTDVLITTDQYAPYGKAIKEIYGVEVVEPRSGKRGRPRSPKKVIPEDLCYATVRKERKKNRIVKVETKIVYGNESLLKEKLKNSTVSNKVNTSFVERNNGTDRGRNSRKGRKTYSFSKQWDIHNASTLFTNYSYNFCWSVRTLRKKDSYGNYISQTPAMSAGLATLIWTIAEWISFPARDTIATG
jgi:IS1 family transposase